MKIRLRWAQHLQCQVIWLIIYYFCRQKPGELDYADLEDLRADIQLGSVPSGGAAAAAPIVRPPAYEGTEYADISQFGVPQPDPTYANVPKQEVVYSNVESMWALTNTLFCVFWIVKGPVTPWHSVTPQRQQELNLGLLSTMINQFVLRPAMMTVACFRVLTLQSAV